jgi:GntR family transcriptional regulator
VRRADSRRPVWKGSNLDIILSNSSGKPIYEQIADQVKEQILSGTLSAGDALPSMRVLAKELRISVITTKRAYEELERDGFLDNVPGKGCFVAPQNRELLREAQLRRVEDVLAQAVDEARKGGFSLSELQELLTLLYQGDEL